MIKLRVFISSPGDVVEERLLTQKVLQRIEGQFAGHVRLEPFLWEQEPLRATSGFQEQILRPSETDIVICILWSRLGTRLPERFQGPEGARYDSGTAWELEDAVNGYKQHGRPDLLVYRKVVPALVSLEEGEEGLLARASQKKKLDAFISRWFHSGDGAITAAFHTFDSTARFEELLELHIGNLIKERLEKTRDIDAELQSPERWWRGSPFRGLQPFGFEHAPVFFGRSAAVGQVLNSLRRQAANGCKLVVVLGMSGSGKSSLVRAGVLPLLTHPGVIEGVDHWRRAVLRPSEGGNGLFDALAAALLQPEALPELTADGSSSADLAESMRRAPDSVPALVKGGLSQAASVQVKTDGLAKQPTANLALVIDQLEEIFTDRRVGLEERRDFVRALCALARSGRVWVLATLRSDFYTRCTELPELVALKAGFGQYDLLPPTPAELSQMIRQPAVASGLRFEVDPVSGARLDDVLRDAAVQSPGALPLLQFALEELYRRRNGDLLTHEVYRGFNGVEGALAKRAEEVFAGLDPRVQRSFPDVMRALVAMSTRGGEALACRSAPVDRVGANPETRALVEGFVSARLFTADRDDRGEPVVRIAHEALLYHWPRLRDWSEKNRDMLRTRARLANAAEHWSQRDNRPDFLLTGLRALAEASELIAAPGSELSETETRFIEASLHRGARWRRLKLGAVSLLAILTATSIAGGYLARRQSQEVERSRKDALIAADALVDELASQLEPLIGVQTEHVRRIVDRAHRVYDKLMGAGDQSEPVLRSKAYALGKLARIHGRLGDLPKAEGLAGDAISILKRLRTSSPDDQALLEQLGRTQLDLARAVGYQGRVSEAFEALNAATALAEGMVSRSPTAPGPRRLLVSCQVTAADGLYLTENFQGALDRCTAIERMFEDQEGALAELGSLAVIEFRWSYARALAMNGRPNDAILQGKLALDAATKESQNSPENAKWQFIVASLESQYAAVLIKMRKENEARESAWAAIVRLEKLRSSDRQNAPYCHELLILFRGIAEQFLRIKDLERAEEYAHKSDKQAKDLLSLASSSALSQGAVASVLDLQGRIDEARHAPMKAIEHYDQARMLLEELQARVGQSAPVALTGIEGIGLKSLQIVAPSYEDRLTDVHEGLAYCRDKCKDHPKARLEWDLVVKGRRRSLERARDPGPARSALKRALKKRAWTLAYLGQGEESASDAQEFVGLDRWASEDSVYMALVAGVGLRRAGKENEATALAQEGADQQGLKQWPRDLLQFASRKIGAGDLLNRAEKGIRTEAETYVGMDRLLSGDVEGGLAHLRWVRDHGDRGYLEHTLACEELKRRGK